MTYLTEQEYESALRRLIDLRFEAKRRGCEPGAEARAIERSIYAAIRRRPNPMEEYAPAPRDGGGSP